MEKVLEGGMGSEEAVLEQREAMDSFEVNPPVESLSQVLSEAYQSSAVFAPDLINMMKICGFCKETYDFADGNLKTVEMKLVEEIALEHLMKRVLMLEVELPDALPNNMGSISLCDECISRFVKNEQEILQDQMKYLEKMSGAREKEDLMTNPLEYAAFLNLKSKEHAIKKKVELLEKFLASAEGFLNVICGASPTSTPGPSSTIPLQTPGTTSNFPSGSSGDVTSSVELGVIGVTSSDEYILASQTPPILAHDSSENEEMF